MRQITHFIRREPESGYWIPLVFITTWEEDGNEKYSFGYETRTLNDWIENAEQTGQIEKIEPAIEVDEEAGLGLWLSHDGKIWVTMRNDPMGYKDKKLINIAAY